MTTTVAPPSTRSAASPGRSGETWGGFTFADPSNPPTGQPTPGPAGDVPDEELIPSAHPGTRTYGTEAEAATANRLASQLTMNPTFVPAGYDLIGAYVVEVPNVGVTDFAVSYRRAGDRARPTTSELFSPALWVGWTSRAPHPLAVTTVADDLGDGRVGSPYQKVVVRGFEGVVVEWKNPPGIDPSLRINSAVIWFDAEWRQWFVHANEPVDTLLRIAESFSTAPRK